MQRLINSELELGGPGKTNVSERHARWCFNRRRLTRAETCPNTQRHSASLFRGTLFEAPWNCGASSSKAWDLDQYSSIFLLGCYLSLRSSTHLRTRRPASVDGGEEAVERESMRMRRSDQLADTFVHHG